MSLLLKTSTSELKKSFVVYDCTGENSSNNKGGYGVSNPRMQDVEEAYLEITNPKNTIFKIVVSPDMPNQKGLGYEILPGMVGNPKNFIPSGRYIIKYVVSGTDRKGIKFKKTAYCNTVFYKDIECCVDKKVKNLNKNSFKDIKQKKIIELSNLMESVRYQAEHGLTEEANQTIEYMNEQCRCGGCE